MYQKKKIKTIIKRVSHYGSPCIYYVNLVQAKIIKIKFLHNLDSLEIFL